MISYRLSICFQRISAIVVRQIQVYDDNFVFTFKIRLFLHKIISYPDIFMKKHFKTEVVEILKKNTKWQINDNDYIDNDVKVRYHCHITGKYIVYAHRDCNINNKSNHKIPTT